MDNNKILLATDDDLPQILAVYQNANRQAHSFLGESIIQISKNLFRDEYFQHTVTLVIKEHNQVVAYVSIIDNDISDLFVDPQFQNKGYGKQLLLEAINNYSCDTVHVFKENKQAYNFYTYHGFRQIGSCIDDLSAEMTFIMKYDMK